MVFGLNSFIFLLLPSSFLVFSVSNAEVRTNVTHSGSPLLQPMPIRLAPNVCTSEAQTIIVVHSSVANFDRRDLIRKTYGSEKYQRKYGYAVLFVTGRKAQNTLFDRWLVEESEMNHDILQGDFIDSYENITIKGLMWMRYVSQACPWSTFVLHLDDDIIFDVATLFNQLINFELEDNAVMCLSSIIRSGEIIRDPLARWFVSYRAFAEEKYPTYCSGAAYVLPVEKLPEMINAITKLEYIPIDDAVITGIARQQLNIGIEQIVPEGLLRADEDVVVDSFIKGRTALAECSTIQCMEHIWHLLTSNMTKRVRLQREPFVNQSYDLLVISSIVLSAGFLLLICLFLLRFLLQAKRIRFRRLGSISSIKIINFS